MSKARFQSVQPTTQWFKSSMILCKYRSPRSQDPSMTFSSNGLSPGHWYQFKFDNPTNCVYLYQCMLQCTTGTCRETHHEPDPKQMAYQRLHPDTSESQCLTHISKLFHQQKPRLEKKNNDNDFVMEDLCTSLAHFGTSGRWSSRIISLRSAYPDDSNAGPRLLTIHCCWVVEFHPILKNGISNYQQDWICCIPVKRKVGHCSIPWLILSCQSPKF